MNEVYTKVRDAFNARAAELAADGRAQRLWQHLIAPTTKQHTDDLVRWAFWHQTQRTMCLANREATDESYFRDTLTWCIDQARADERRRIGETIAKGIQAMLGEDGAVLVQDVAAAMGLFDHE